MNKTKKTYFNGRYQKPEITNLERIHEYEDIVFDSLKNKKEFIMEPTRTGIRKLSIKKILT